VKVNGRASVYFNKFIFDNNLLTEYFKSITHLKVYKISQKFIEYIAYFLDERRKPMCGIVGINYNDCQAAQDAYICLYNLQHRGKEGAGIVSYDKHRYYIRKKKGEVAQVFPDKNSLSALKGNIAVAQVRYSTTGAAYREDSHQPIAGWFKGRKFFLVHNGNIVNLNTENVNCKQEGCSDTYLVVRKIEQSKKTNFVDALIEVVKLLEGSFAFIVMYRDRLYVIQDRFGFRPLSMGKKNGGYVVTSETCALDMIEAEYVRTISPGEIVTIKSDGYEVNNWTREVNFKFDIFELIYFSRPDSIVYGVEIGLARYYMGRKLASTHPVAAQLIIPIPDSGNDGSLGYFDEARLHYPELRFIPSALFRSHYVGRTFIEPIHENRIKAQRQKFNTRWMSLLDVSSLIMGDDSLIRSIVIQGRVKTLLDLALKEYFGPYRLQTTINIEHKHTRIFSPPYAYPDPYGVDTYRAEERLIWNDFNGDVARISDHLGLESLAYLSVEDMIKAVLAAQAFISQYVEIPCVFSENSFYTGPFTGEYPDGTGCYDFTVI
jgi:amidophosphoribosyltransferase